MLITFIPTQKEFFEFNSTEDKNTLFPLFFISGAFPGISAGNQVGDLRFKT